MSSFNKNKLFLIPSLLILNFIGMIHCSYQPDNFNFQYPALKQPNDQNLIEKRKQFTASENSNIPTMLKIFPNTSAIIKFFLPSSKPGVCYNWAIKKTLGLTDKQFRKIESLIVGCEDWVKIIGMPYDFFDQIKEPHPECLATYTSAEDNFHILHMAVTSDNGQLLSKLGTRNFILQHDAWKIDHRYGDQLHFWQLKQEYCNNKKLLFETLLNRTFS